MSSSNNIILAIESAVCGGSISLIIKGVEAVNWIGSANVSKAEDLLLNIDAILTSANISRHDIDLIAVSAGPGSFTGIRIGLATALGFKDGLGVDMASESALRAMVLDRPGKEILTAALPVGRDTVCLQKFQIGNGEIVALNAPNTMPDGQFVEFVRNQKVMDFVLHQSLYERCDPTSNITNFGENIAFAIGSICAERPGVVTDPLFIRKSV